MTDDELEAALDELYAGPADAFVAGRDALVKRLRAAGRREDATAIGRLRRPSVVAAALNAAARRAPADVQRLLELGGALREAQEAMLAGGNPAAVRELVAERRRVVGSLAEGIPDPHHDEAVATLEAASLGGEAGELLQRGRLERELEGASGFDLLLGATAANRPPAPRPRRAKSTPDEDRPDARAAAARAEEEAERRRRAEARADAEAELRAARDALEAADARVDRLEEELAAARRVANKARTRLTAAERARAAVDGD